MSSAYVRDDNFIYGP